MILEDALSGVSLLYVETAPFIYFTEARAVFVDKMRAIFAEVSNNQITVLTSAITLAEILIKSLQANDTALLNQYDTLFYHTPGIRVTPVSPAAGELAARLRSQYGLRTPDAVHVASAIDTGCETFLTNDTGIKRVTDIRILVLDDLELTDQHVEPED